MFISATTAPKATQAAYAHVACYQSDKILLQFDSFQRTGTVNFVTIPSVWGLRTKMNQQKIKCPFCGDEFNRSDLPKNFAFKEQPSWNCRGYLCCNLCDAPVTELEKLEEDD